MRFREYASAKPVRRFVLVLEPADEVVTELRRFAEQHRVMSAQLVGLGAFSRARIAFWDPQTRDYHPIEIGEQVEVLSLIGNVAWSGTQSRIHAHVTLGTSAGHARGGHLLEGHVYPTLELFLTELPETLRRAVDPSTGLQLLALDA